MDTPDIAFYVLDILAKDNDASSLLSLIHTNKFFNECVNRYQVLEIFFRKKIINVNDCLKFLFSIENLFKDFGISRALSKNIYESDFYLISEVIDQLSIQNPENPAFYLNVIREKINDWGYNYLKSPINYSTLDCLIHLTVKIIRRRDPEIFRRCNPKIIRKRDPEIFYADQLLSKLSWYKNGKGTCYPNYFILSDLLCHIKILYLAVRSCI